MDDMDFGDTESTSATATVTVEDSDASEVNFVESLHWEVFMKSMLDRSNIWSGWLD